MSLLASLLRNSLRRCMGGTYGRRQLERRVVEREGRAEVHRWTLRRLHGDALYDVLSWLSLARRYRDCGHARASFENATSR
jgi:hypothetical protein